MGKKIADRGFLKDEDQWFNQGCLINWRGTSQLIKI